MNHLKTDAEATPPTNRALLAAASILLAIPVGALLWVDSYARIEPTLAGFPFFFWYQFMWVILCAICTWVAYRLVRAARPARKGVRR